MTNKKPYNCDLCDYSTTNKYNLGIHYKSMKHIENVKNASKFVCPHCSNEYALKKCLDVHLKSCVVKNGVITNQDAKYNQQENYNKRLLKEKNDLVKNHKKEKLELLNQYNNDKQMIIVQYENYKKELLNQYNNDKQTIITQYENCKNECIKVKDEEIALLAATITDLRKDITQLHLIIDKGETIFKSSISAMKYAMKHFSNAPALTAFTSYELLETKNKNSTVDNILFSYKNDLLHKYIGDIIIKAYKKDKVVEQSMWNTDSTRLSYIIKCLVDKNDLKKCEWQVDKNATYIRENIISPILAHIRSILLKDAERLNIYYGKKGHKFSDYEMHLHIETLKGISNLTHELESFPHLEQNIIKHISPYFFINSKIDNIK